jgi:hypothetical protein
MLIQVHQTMGYVTRSILRGRLVAEVDVESCPEDLHAFADEHGGDYLEVAPGDEDHE